MKSDYEQRRQARINRLRERAEKKEAEAAREYGKASSLQSMIPLGQPILVGHHSERRHRRDLEKIDNSIRRGVEASKAADELERRANAAEANNAISSDDPDSVEKMRENIAEMERRREHMKKANAAFRKVGRPGHGPEHDAAWIRYAEILGVSPDCASVAAARRHIEMAYSFHRTPFPSYALANLGANIRRCKDRLKKLEYLANMADRPDREGSIGDVDVIDSPSENRLQLYFSGKPDAATRGKLKRHGFRWARSLGCWQRMRGIGAEHAAEAALGPITWKGGPS